MTEKLSDERLNETAESYKRITERLERAMEAAGRKDKVRLMGVTKTVSPQLINHSVELGIRLLGENRVQEFLDKQESYDSRAEVHFIGGLQTNKVKYIIDKVSMIHSVDSLRLGEEISRRALAKGIQMDVLAEINIGGEESKGGVSPESLDELVYALAELPGIRLRGFMTIPPVNENGSSEGYFEKMQRIFSDYKDKTAADSRFSIDTLSMGMSGDFETAVKYGSNIVRIGSLLYGYRKY